MVDRGAQSRGDGKPSLQSNVAANFASQAFVTLIGVATMPFYLRHMGAEAYGLVGFFTLLNAWFQILDAGLSQTLARETVRFRAGAIEASTLRALVRTLEAMFWGTAIVGGIVIVLASPLIATHWLKARMLGVPVVTQAVLLMGLTAPLQWVTGLYRGALNGFERQVWLAGLNIVVNAARFGGAAAVILWLGPSPVNFFVFQLAVSLVEVAALTWAGRRLIPNVELHARRWLNWAEMRDLGRFSGAIAFTVVLGGLVTQVDKIALSRVMPLGEFGIFSLTIVAAGGVTIVGLPIAQAVIPRLTKLAAQGDARGVTRLYSDATQLTCVVALSAAIVLAFFAGPVLSAWTGNIRAAAAGGPILTAYALAYGVQAVAAFAYYLQYAHGRLRLHVIANVLYAITLTPLAIWSAVRFGAVGTGYAWLAVNLAYLLGFTPILHRQFLPGGHLRWLIQDVAVIAAPAALVAWALSAFVTWPAERVAVAIELACIAAVVVTSAACGSSLLRGAVWRLARKWIE